MENIPKVYSTFTIFHSSPACQLKVTNSSHDIIYEGPTGGVCL